ncbi:MAG: HAD-IIB family hydrolase [Desulfobulbaceae bacterium]|nr:HAD-IIB family hydrolase [Desulfobulbaceae bacterium]HIJ78584.1 HAD-IIB family hydrolase [Deltaproteobacteria bacterium]
MPQQYLLCSDLDRTILPNGHQEESPGARKLLAKLAGQPQIKLAYVSGRHKKLLQDAIVEYDIPTPDFAICDVGTTIYTTSHNEWQPCLDWSAKIGADWQGKTAGNLIELLADLNSLTLQEPEKQNSYKLSFYTPVAIDLPPLRATIRDRLEQAGIKAGIIFSIDEMAKVGLLDILPSSADKLQAIKFLMAHEGFSDSHTVFAGDSGNDLSVLTSGMKSILVRNADNNVREEAQRYLAATDQLQQLYLAHGGFSGMNGNYAAGVLEGFYHFFPEVHQGGIPLANNNHY